MTARRLRITHVCGGRDYAKVHRLVTPVPGLMQAHGQPLACGRTFNIRPAAGTAGWEDYPEDGHVGMCQQCRAVPEGGWST